MLRPASFYHKCESLDYYFYDFEKMYCKTNLWEGFEQKAEQFFHADILDYTDYYVLQAELPGFHKDEIKITAGENYINISAKHSQEALMKQHYIHRERYHGTYSRDFYATDVNTREISTLYQNGLLLLILPKKSIAKE